MPQRGWLECPKNPLQGKWIWHEDFPNPPWGWAGSMPMLVVDLNGDGKNEIITGNAHGYGLWWSEQKGYGAKRDTADCVPRDTSGKFYSAI